MIALPETIRLINGSEEYPLLLIEHPLCSARVALHGAHLMEWTPSGHSPVLYLSPTAVYREGKAIRGGIPICWPWFGAHPSEASQPAHGPVRNKFWELIDASSSETGVRLCFRFTDHDAIRSSWDHPFELTLEMLLGQSMELHLHTRNTGDLAFPISGALHTYFQVGDVSQVRLPGLVNCDYLDGVNTPWQQGQQIGAFTWHDEVCRIYDSSADVILEDSQLARRILLYKQGSASTIVWNPGPTKGAGFGDLPVEDISRFLCVEVANVNAAAVTVEPGASHSLSMRVAVEHD